LDGAESAVLAALLQRPNANADVVARRARAIAEIAGARPLATVTDEAIDDDAIAAAAARLDAATTRLAATGGAPARTDLAPPLAHHLLAGRDAPRVSTLDAGAQRVADDALGRALAALKGRNVADGAVLAVDNASGDVLAYVGGSGAFSRA